jgi:hypothetical protein
MALHFHSGVQGFFIHMGFGRYDLESGVERKKYGMIIMIEAYRVLPGH